MSSHRTIRKARTGTGQSMRRILNRSRTVAALRQPTDVHAVRVEDAGGGMAHLTVSEMLPRSVAERVAHLLGEGDLSRENRPAGAD